ncbi:hypothetical protein PsAD2_02807 [Pseudovibrio axinellae]|uniref:ABM domain-containing protein n=1 Tax=Pseudovibrio axinellae TaxID=989403 RepID=A0A165XPY4_9HYPH|nr:hypothetical protein [Pseudovibrio axinellae]KZL17930.1 hypothetical protein PsAD2_02807 [Pseudovibrio axinellae]SER76618.1 hypothetical protein SAMN05421798_12117 [Pseudovibrio axinellae]
MTAPITVIAQIKLAKGKTEKDLLTASDAFEVGFASKQPGILRRELVRKPDGTYLDVVKFRSANDMDVVIEKEKTSEICHAFFSVMDMTDEEFEVCQSLKTYE